MRGRRTLGLVVVATTWLLAAGSAHATDRFVATGGADAGACLSGAPCLTVQKAFDVASAGDRIVIGAGTFTGHAATATRVDVVGAGSAGAGTTILAGNDSNPTVELRGGGSVSAVLIRANTGGGLSLTSTTAPTPAVTYAVSNARIEGPLPGCASLCLVAALSIVPNAAVPSQSVTATVDHVDVTTGVGYGGINANGLGVSATLRAIAVASSHAGAVLVSFANGADGSVADATITGTGDGFDLVGSSSPPDPTNVTITRAHVDVSAEAIFTAVGSSTVIDSLLVSHGGGGVVVQGIGTAPIPATDLVLRGSTLYADSAVGGARGLQAYQSAGTNAPTVELTNTIVRAVNTGPGMPAYDIEAHGAQAAVTASHSSFTTTVLTSGAPASAIPVAGAGTNVSGDPGLVGPALPTADFHLAAASPLIDKGDASIVTVGETDVAGAARSLDGNGDCAVTPDIGAFEAPAKAAGSCPGGGGGSDHTPPTLTGVAFSPAIFRAIPAPRKRPSKGRKPAKKAFASAAAHRKKARPHRRGSHLKAKVSEKSTLEVAIVLCRNKRCTKTKRVGTVRFVLKAGRNSVSFNGRIGRKALKRGRYRATVRAIDAAKNASPKRTVFFTIVAR